MFVFAQLSTSVSDDQIRLIIIALLIVAILLAALTIWFFVKTSPSRRVRVAQTRRQTTADRPGVGGTATAGAPPGASTGSGASRPAASTTTRPVEVLIDEDEGDEWDRLTAPEPRRPASS